MRSFLITCHLLLSVSVVLSGAQGNPWPASWSQAPQTASQLDLDAFTESPALMAETASGALPRVKDRLPDDPIVVQPFEKIGNYCRKIRVFEYDLDKISVLEPPLRICPEISRILPNLAESFRLSEDGKTFTLKLRKGLRWSDGHPFTTDDFEFAFKHHFQNKDLVPTMPVELRGASFYRDGPLVCRYVFDEPNPFIINRFAHSGDNYYRPKHFLRDYHPDFVGKEEVEARARKANYISWMAYFNAVRQDRMRQPVGTPTMRSHVLTERTPTVLTYYRNPYYCKVDPSGKQLPYIDTIEAQVENNREVIAAKTSTGQVHFSAYSLRTSDIPLFKLGEKPGLVKVYIWKKLMGTDVAIQPNFNHPNPVKRAVFSDLRFRKALSHAIDRDEINTIIYFGKGTPRQTTVIPTSKFYEPEFANAHLKYDPDYARKLLDEMGMKDIDGDGLREAPGGEAFAIVLEWVDIETPKELTLELASEYWRDIGLNFQHRQVDRSLQGTRATANMMDMTVWHADRSTDILMPPQPFWYVPMHMGWEECHWNEWSRYYLTKGELGEKPTGEIAKVVEWWDAMKTTTDEAKQIEYGKQILRSSAENLWTIGTVGLSPMAVVVRPGMRNVPELGYWGWDGRFTAPYHPETWTFEERP